MAERWWRVGFLGILLTVICACGAPQVAPPIDADLSGTDASVAELLGKLLAEAQSDPTDAEKRAHLGMAYEVSGLPNAALLSFEQVVTMTSDQPVWWYYLALARSNADDLDGALLAMQETMALDDTYVPAYLHRGNWLLDDGLIDEAGADFKRATQLAPGFPAAWIGLSRVLMAQGRNDQAVDVLERLVTKFNHPYIDQMLGTAYRKQGNLERAKLMLARVTPGPDPGWPDPWHDKKVVYKTGFGAGMIRAQDLGDRGKLPEALKILEALRQERPDDLALLNNLSVMYRQIGRPEDPDRIGHFECSGKFIGMNAELHRVGARLKNHEYAPIRRVTANTGNRAFNCRWVMRKIII